MARAPRRGRRREGFAVGEPLWGASRRLMTKRVVAGISEAMATKKVSLLPSEVAATLSPSMQREMSEIVYGRRKSRRPPAHRGQYRSTNPKLRHESTKLHYILSGGEESVYQFAGKDNEDHFASAGGMLLRDDADDGNAFDAVYNEKFVHKDTESHFKDFGMTLVDDSDRGNAFDRVYNTAHGRSSRSRGRRSRSGCRTSSPACRPRPGTPTKRANRRAAPPPPRRSRRAPARRRRRHRRRAARRRRRRSRRSRRRPPSPPRPRVRRGSSARPSRRSRAPTRRGPRRRSWARSRPRARRRRRAAARRRPATAAPRSGE